MDEDIRIFINRIIPNNPALNTHLRHTLDTTHLLLNLEICALTLTTEQDTNFLKVLSGIEKSAPPDNNTTPSPNSQKTPADAITFRQNIRLSFEKIAGAANDRSIGYQPHAANYFQTPPTGINSVPETTGPVIELYLVRSALFGEFTAVEKDVAGRAMESINRTITAYINDGWNDQYAATLNKLLAHFRIGLVKLDRQFDIVEKSSLVDDLLESTANYRCESNQLVNHAPRKGDIFQRSIKRLNAENKPYSIVDVVITRSDGQCAIVLTKFPACIDGIANGYLVFILCPVEDHLRAVDLLDFWHVSPAEKRVLAGLTRFGNIKKVAIELNISPNTVKSQLKSAYKKLGVDNKISLLRHFALLRLIDALTNKS